MQWKCSTDNMNWLQNYSTFSVATQHPLIFNTIILQHSYGPHFTTLTKVQYVVGIT